MSQTGKGKVNTDSLVDLAVVKSQKQSNQSANQRNVILNQSRTAALNQLLSSMDIEDQAPQAPGYFYIKDQYNLDNMIKNDSLQPDDYSQKTRKPRLTNQQLELVREQIDASDMTANQKEAAKRTYSQANQDKIAARNAVSKAEAPEIEGYLNSQPASTFSPGLARIIKKLFSGFNYGVVSGEPAGEDLIKAVSSGFLKKGTADKQRIVISLGNMFKANESASIYDKAVIRKAKRIVRMIKGQISASKLKTDIPISKQYIAAKAYQSYYKVAKLPRAKIAYIKDIAQRYNTTNKDEYQQKALDALSKGVLKTYQSVSKKINNANKFNQFQDPTSVAEAANFRELIADKILGQ